MTSGGRRGGRGSDSEKDPPLRRWDWIPRAFLCSSLEKAAVSQSRHAELEEISVGLLSRLRFKLSAFFFFFFKEVVKIFFVIVLVKEFSLFFH